MSERIALFCGSFDPFHKGHEYIVHQASYIFDKIIVCVANNPDKKYMQDSDVRTRNIKEKLKGYDNVEVINDSGMVVDTAKKYNAQFIVKGLRNVKDFEAEMIQSDVNMYLGGLQTIFVPTPTEYSFISSSLIRKISKVRNSEEYVKKLTTLY